MNFKNPEEMLPSELVDYVGILHAEIQAKDKEVKELRKPNTYVLGQDVAFMDEAAMLADIPLGSVREATTFRKLEQTWLVKVSDHRVDNYPDRITAEGVAMLHRT